jgi:ferrous iron transport protein B
MTVRFSQELGVPVYRLVASTGEGVATLREGILAQLVQKRAASASTFSSLRETRRFYTIPEKFQEKVDDLAEHLARRQPQRVVSPEAEALLLLSDERVSESPFINADLKAEISKARQELDDAGCDWRTAVIEARYGTIALIQERVATENIVFQETFSDKLDRILTHKVWGMLIFVGIMALMFQSIFTLAEYPMKGIEAAVGALGR